MEKNKVYIENPKYLDVVQVGIRLVDSSECFVEHPELPDYYISNYGRLWSAKSRKLLRPQQIGTYQREGQMRPAYKLPDEKKRYRNYRICKLVSDIFCENKYDDTVKVVVHHKDGNPQNDVASNLQVIPRGQHDLIHSGKRIFTYGNGDGELTERTSMKELCEAVGADRRKIYKAISNGEIICTLDDGNIKIVALKNIVDENEQTVFVGYQSCPFVKATPEADENDDGLPLLETCVVGAALIWVLVQTVRTHIKRSKIL